MEIKTVGQVVTITLDLSKKGDISKSGKSRVIESTHGFTQLPGGFALSLNLIKKD